MRLTSTIALSLLLAVQCIHARNINVCPTCECTSVRSAVQEAKDGDKITLGEGVYREGNIVIEREIELSANGKVILDGENKYEILTVRANNVTLSNLILQNSGTGFSKDVAAIKIERVKNCWVKGCTIVNSYFGIYVSFSQGCVLRDNVVKGNAVSELTAGNAIHIWNSRKIMVLNNKLSNHRDGIYLEVTDHCRVESNHSANNLRYGLHFMFSDNAAFKKNVLTKNQVGVAVMYSHHIMMLENKLSYNWGSASYGMLLKEMRDGMIAGNIFHQNTTGIFAEGLLNTEIYQNSFDKNGWAVKIADDCTGNSFFRNNFMTNTFELGTNSRTNTNCYERNFWSHYSGYDLNRDGVGDVPHHPATIFTYLVERQPESVLLMRSPFVDLLNLAEKVNPAYTPVTLQDEKPMMQKI